jgi:hypothetical protein
LATLKYALRETSGSKVHATSATPRARAQARWWSLRAKPMLRPMAGRETPAMWLCRLSSLGAWKNATHAPISRPPSKAPAT